MPARILDKPKILNKFVISNNLISFNKHKRIPLLKALMEGKSIAIVSDAGMPGICDPGEDFTKRVKAEGLMLFVYLVHVLQ